MEEVERTGNEANERPPIPSVMQKRIRKIDHKYPDPLVKGFVFMIADDKGNQWAYRVYDERKRARKFIERLGIVVNAPVVIPQPPELEVEFPKDLEEALDNG